jgi:hypothetical protein
MYGLGDFGCCGDTPGLGNIPWGYLGQDGTDSTDIMGPTLEEIAGGPVDTITNGDIATYVSGGSVDPSIVDQIANIVKAAGPSVQQILQQVQLGQIAASAPIANNPAMRAAIVGSSTMGTSVSSAIASLSSSPVLILGGVGLLFLLMRRRK